MKDFAMDNLQSRPIGHLGAHVVEDPGCRYVGRIPSERLPVLVADTLRLQQRRAPPLGNRPDVLFEATRAGIGVSNARR